MRRMVSILLLGDRIALGSKVLGNQVVYCDFLAVDLIPFSFLQQRTFFLGDQVQVLLKNLGFLFGIKPL